MKHVMIDLETLGQTPGCRFFSVGAVPFNPETGTLGQGKLILINPNEKGSLFTEQSTLDWWAKQSDEARKELTKAEEEGVTLKEGMEILTDYLIRCEDLGPITETRVWGNGSDFDNAIMSAGYKAADLPVPWKFWNNRCFRTLKSMAPKSLEPTRQGVHHNALADAEHQARWANAILKDMGLTQCQGL